TIYELLSAPISYLEIVVGYVGAAATKSVILGLIILATAWLFVPLRIAHPFWMAGFLLLTAVTFSLLGFIIGIWADGFEKLQLVPLLIITPLTIFEIVVGYVGAAATKSVILGLIILATAWLFVPLRIAHPFWMAGFLLLTAVTFSLLGFIIGIWADGFEKLQLVPLLIITPLTFL